ncbi:amino acid adenylation domain-containing protein, partial [Nonomuraea sp. K274]
MAPIEYEFPVSPAQARLLVLDQLNPGTAQYNVPLAFAVRGDFDPDVFGACLDTAVAGHESLRTVFRAYDGAYLQVVAAEAKAALRIERDVPAAAAHGLLRAAAEEPFDLAAGPLLRCHVYALDDGTHRILLTAHHLVCDGWSLRLLLRELSDTYRTLTGSPRPVQEDPAPAGVQYPDYAAWQRERIDSGALDGAVAFWAESLRDAPGVLALPTDHPRPAVQSTAGGVTPLRLPADTRERLAKVAAERDATPFMALFAAFAAFLARVSGQRDLVVAVPVSGRDHPDLQGVIGLLANTLAVRADLSGDPSFLDLVGRVRERLVAAQPYQDAPFEAVVEAVAPGRELSHDPLVQVMFAYDDDTRLLLDLPGATAERVELLLDDAKFDLLMNVERGPGGLSAQFVHRADLFTPGTVRHWARAFETLLDGLLDRPGEPVTAAALLPEEDRRLILDVWNRTAAPTPARLVPDLIADRALERPNAIALVSGPATRTSGPAAGHASSPPAAQASDPTTEQVSGPAAAHASSPVAAQTSGPAVLTYRELLDRADRLAARLRAAGVGPGVPVGLCLPRGADMVVAAVAVLRAGGAYVPLDPGHPPARLKFMIGDAGIRLVLAAEPMDLDAGTQVVLTSEPRNPDAGTRAVLTQEPRNPGAPAAEVRDAPIEPIGPVLTAQPAPGDVAYILYTSGSTGTPKGVAVEHRALLNLATAVRAQFPVTGEDRVLQYVSFGFDVAVSDVVFTLVAGAELHVAAESERLGDDLYARLRDSRITYAFLPPSAAMSLPCPPDALPDLRTLAIGGEACPAELVERWATPARRVVDAYGPTETTVYATTADLVPGRPVVIGRPVANGRAYVLDDRLRPVPVGLVGEIYLAGAGVARGYANRPGLTAERFVADPYGPPGGRMYRTGDLGRYDAGGVLSYLGRVDTQVKLRGFRVELGEVETVLAAHPRVAVAAATLRGDSLAVYVVPASGEPPPAWELRAWLGERLPGYMVPDAVVFLDELPVNRSGKVDR